MKKIIYTIYTLVVIILLLGILFLPINITIYRDPTNPLSETVYGKSNLFERIFNSNCPKVYNPKTFNYDTQSYDDYADEIVSCKSEKRWFYD